MTDPTLPADLGRYLLRLEQRIADLERGNRLQRSSAHDGTRARVEVGTYIDPATSGEVFGFHLVSAAGATLLKLNGDGLSLGAVIDATNLPASAGATGSLWVNGSAVQRA